MTNKNDETIIKLKSQIIKKKEKLGKISRFSPVTNLSLELEERRFNLNVLNKEGLEKLAIKVNAYNNSAKELGLEGVLYGGYVLSDWLEDINSKLSILTRKEEEKELLKLEEKLSKMLSDGKRIELELEEIEGILKED